MSIQNPFFWVTTLLSESPSDSSGIGGTNMKMWTAEYKKITKALKHSFSFGKDPFASI